jgi:hypothetical protein
LHCFRVCIQDMTPMTVTKGQVPFAAVSGSIRLNGPFVSGACLGLRSHCQMVYSLRVSSVLYSLMTSLAHKRFSHSSRLRYQRCKWHSSSETPRYQRHHSDFYSKSYHRLYVRFKSLANNRFVSLGVPCDALSRPAVRNGSH